jgi:hypothetical protein
VSGISVSWSDGHLHLGCMPDPQRPARLLETVLPSWTPPADAGVVSLLQQMATSDGERVDRERANAVLAGYVQSVVHGLRQDADADVVLLGEVDRLVLIPPPMVSPAAVRRLAEFVERASGMPTIAVGGAAAVLASGGDLIRPDGVYLVCHWDEDLRVFCARPTADLRTLERISRISLLRGAGATGFHAMAMRLLRNRFPGLSDSDVRRAVEACAQSTNGSRRGHTTAPVAVDDGEAERNDFTCALDQVERHRSTWLRRAEGFLTSAYQEQARLRPVAAIVACGCRGWPAAAELMERVFTGRGLPVRVASIECEHAGAHRLCPDPPLLPYDCGVLIRRPGASLGAGCLVLIRPESIGTRRVSDVLEHPAQPGDVLEAAAYLRRVDFADRRVSYELLERRTFAAKPRGGTVRLIAAMAVGSVDEPGGAVTVSIDIDDLEAGSSIRFRDLRLHAGTIIDRPPTLSGAAIAGAHWAARMAERISGSMQTDRPIEAWIGLFRSRSTRTEYAAEVISAAGATVWSLLSEPAFVSDADPEAFQAAARTTLFTALCRLAVTQHRIPAVVAWTATWPVASLPDDARAVRELVNALSTGGAAAGVIEKAARLLSLYETAAAPAAHLNVDW